MTFKPGDKVIPRVGGKVVMTVVGPEIMQYGQNQFVSSAPYGAPTGRICCQWQAHYLGGIESAYFWPQELVEA